MELTFYYKKIEFTGIIIAECLTDKRRGAFFPGGTMVRDLHHRKFPNAASRTSTLQNLSLDFIE